MSLYVNGGEAKAPTQPPKLAKELKARVGDLLQRYTFTEILRELATQHKKHDIIVTEATKGPRRCPACGAGLPRRIVNGESN